MMALRDHFRGVLLGAVIGDCLGSFWETAGKKTIRIDDVQRKIDEQVEQSLRRTFRISYTDDSTMTFGMAESLVSCKIFDAKDMASRFSADYFRDPRRGYGQNVSTVFTKLRFGVKDVYQPAAEQFDGQGSFGNGSAMRVSPAVLFAYDNKETMMAIARDSARITHAHPSAIVGCVLQASAIHLALESRGTTLDPVAFIESLLTTIVPLETESTTTGAPDPNPLPSYQSKLLQIKEFIACQPPPQPEDIARTIGTGIQCCEAVPCAIMAFLNCHSQSFKYLIPYVISLGGDTDTIASMAGAMAGAYWGEDKIPSEWVNSVEGASQAIKLADALLLLNRQSK